MPKPDARMKDYIDRLNRMVEDALSQDYLGATPASESVVAGLGLTPLANPKKASGVTISPIGTRIVVPYGKHAWHYFQSGTWKFAWTSFPDANGDFFSWCYKPIGKGSQSDPTRWTSVKVSKARRRGSAKKIALRRLVAYQRKHAPKAPPSDFDPADPGDEPEMSGGEKVEDAP